MSGGQRKSNVTIRTDLRDMLTELKFEDIRLAADVIAPPVQVSKDSGRYPLFNRENVLKFFDTRRKNDGSYQRGAWEWGDDSYLTYEYGFEEPIDNVQSMLDSEYINHEEIAAKLAYHNLRMSREARLAAAMLNTTTFTGSTNVTDVSNAWTVAADATIFADVDNACKAIRGKCALGKSVMSVIMSEDILDYAIRTNEVKNFVTYNNNADLIAKFPVDERARWLASYLGVKEVIITSALYDTAKLGAATTVGKFWSNAYVFVGYLPKDVNFFTPAVARQLNWSQYSPDFLIETYPVDEKNQIIVRAREFKGIKIHTSFGHLLTGIKSVTNGI